MNRIILLLICFLIISCHSTESGENISMGKYSSVDNALELGEEIEFEPGNSGEDSNAFDLEKGSKIIKNGNLNFEVTELEISKSKVDELITSSNGYYENELFQSNDYRNTYSLKIRVPNIKFDSLIWNFENGIGTLKSKNINALDVSEEYVDLNIRLENKLAYLNQYQTILKKAKTIKEILNVQEKIRKIEEEIESKKGRIKYLDDKVNFSTINLELYQSITQSNNKPSFGKRISKAFNKGSKGFVSFVIGLINFWPFLLIIGLIFLGRKPILKKLRKRNSTNS